MSVNELGDTAVHEAAGSPEKPLAGEAVGALTQTFDGTGRGTNQLAEPGMSGSGMVAAWSSSVIGTNGIVSSQVAPLRRQARKTADAGAAYDHAASPSFRRAGLGVAAAMSSPRSDVGKQASQSSYNRQSSLSVSAEIALPWVPALDTPSRPSTSKSTLRLEPAAFVLSTESSAAGGVSLAHSAPTIARSSGSTKPTKPSQSITSKVTTPKKLKTIRPRPETSLPPPSPSTGAGLEVSETAKRRASGSVLSDVTKRPPRPQNSWLLFRTSVQKANKEQFRGLTQAEVSKIVGQMWQNESPETKLWYEQRAEIEKINHRAAYPDYRFSPRRKDKDPSKATGKSPSKSPSKTPTKRKKVQEASTPPSTDLEASASTSLVPSDAPQFGAVAATATPQLSHSDASLDRYRTEHPQDQPAPWSRSMGHQRVYSTDSIVSCESAHAGADYHTSTSHTQPSMDWPVPWPMRQDGTGSSYRAEGDRHSNFSGSAATDGLHTSFAMRHDPSSQSYDSSSPDPNFGGSKVVPSGLTYGSSWAPAYWDDSYSTELSTSEPSSNRVFDAPFYRSEPAAYHPQPGGQVRSHGAGGY